MGKTARTSSFARTSGGCRNCSCHCRRSIKSGSKISHTLYFFYRELESPSRRSSSINESSDRSIEEETFMKNNISFRIIGETEKLPADVLNRLNQCVQRTSKNTGMCLVLALSYSSKWEITKAVKEISEKVACGELNINDITDQTVSQYLATNFMPDPDLLIRTGGEVRLSNYMLWQCAYSELYFCDTFWPDFKEEELCKAICDYQRRERRFGKTSEQILK